MKNSIVFFTFLFAVFSSGHAQNYSIKNRWNTKLSISYNRTNEINTMFFMSLDKVPIHPYQARLNVRAECNYGILNWLELGGYVGYMRYHNPYRVMENSKLMALFAPTFGINTNVHLLPFWVKNNDCRYELYVTAEYGAAYLIRHLGFKRYGFGGISTSTATYTTEDSCGAARYRPIFGIGIGGGIYFKNIVGLYTEVKIGQYSYFPEMCKVYWTARVGIEFKFYSKRKNRENQIIWHKL